MKTIKTNELIGPALDWAVQEIEYQRMVAEGEHVKQWALDDHRAGASINHYSTDWLWGGPIIEREGIGIRQYGDFLESRWQADKWAFKFVDPMATGPTPLIAAMRCLCRAKLGDEVDIPDELLP